MDSQDLPTALEKLSISNSPTATHAPVTASGSTDHSPLTAALENLTLSGSINPPAIVSQTITTSSTKETNTKKKKPRKEKSLERKLHDLCSYLKKYYNRINNSRNASQNYDTDLEPEEYNSWRESRRRSYIIMRMCRRRILDAKTVDNVLEFEKNNPDSEIGKEISRLMNDIGEGRIRYKYRELMKKGEEVYNLINSI